MRSLLLALAVYGCTALAAACGGSPTGPSSSGQPTTYLSITSNPGDLIGNGFTQRAGWGRAISFTLPAGVPLGPGTFEYVRPEFGGGGGAPEFLLLMYPEQPFDRCGASTSRWRISEFSASGSDTIDRRLMTFEVRCERATASLFGEVSLAGGTVPF
jgi:hypothetical protein